MRPVAHPAVTRGRAPGVQRIAQGRPGQRPPRRVHVVDDADPDVLASLHHAWVAARRVGAGGYPPAAPRNLIGCAPVEGEAGGEFAKAKRRGLSIRGVALELGIHRDMAKKYMEAASPPMKRSARPGRGDLITSDQLRVTLMLVTYADIFAGHRHPPA